MALTEQAERELVKAAVTGDIDSFGQLAGQYYPALVAIGYSILADHGLAEDAAQEAFARALPGLKALKNKSKFVPWLARICRNVAKDMVAARAGQANREDFSRAAESSRDDESIHAVRQAIGKLPVSARELIVLRYYDGLSYEEISAVLGITRAAINGRLTRAKRKMARYLRREGVMEQGL